MFKGKKEERSREKELQKTGLYLETIADEKKDRRGLLCFIRGILVFMACFSTIGAVITSFGLQFNVPLVSLLMLLLAMASAYVYYNKVTFYLGYAFLFFILIVMAFAFYLYINSGFQALLNEMRDAYTAFFDLPAGRMSEEMITDRTKTVSYMMVFVAAVFSIFFNITISGYMDLPTTFLVSFIPLMLPFYIDRVPKRGYLLMLLSVYISVLLLSRSGRFTLPYRYKKDMPYGKKTTKKKNTYFYMASAFGMVRMLLYALVLSAAFMLISGSVFNERFSTRNVSNPVKDLSDKYVKMIVTGGVSSLLNRYDAKGGLSKGKLGGIRSVSPDFETDLKVLYNPKDFNIMYLKGYTGVYYSYNEFKAEFPPELSPENELPWVDLYSPETIEFYDSSFGYHTSDISIKNVDTEEGIYFSPYFTFFSPAKDSVFEDAKGWYSMVFLPYDFIPFSPDTDAAPEYTDYAKKYYTVYPESLEETLKKTCEEAGLEKNGDPLKNADLLKQYFIENFKYTMTPGAVPYGEDAINYFLTRQKRGYCAHFASSAALILRYAGIPTRYAEGYILTESDVTKRFSDERVLAEITDASAHSWVEIYVSGLGWIPFEFTPPSEEDAGSDINLPFFLNGLVMQTERNNTGAGESDIASDNFIGEKNKRSSISYLYLPFIYTAAFVFFVFLLINLSRTAMFLLKILYLEYKGDYDNALLLRNRPLLRRIRRKFRLSDETVFFKNEEEYLLDILSRKKEQKISRKEISYVINLLKEAAYSKRHIKRDEYCRAKKALKSLSLLSHLWGGNRPKDVI